MVHSSYHPVNSWFYGWLFALHHFKVVNDMQCAYLSILKSMWKYWWNSFKFFDVRYKRTFARLRKDFSLQIFLDLIFMSFVRFKAIFFKRYSHAILNVINYISLSSTLLVRIVRLTSFYDKKSSKSAMVSHIKYHKPCDIIHQRFWFHIWTYSLHQEYFIEFVFVGTNTIFPSVWVPPFFCTIASNKSHPEQKLYSLKAITIYKTVYKNTE